ncbi:MAG: hypothetical protein LUE89_00745 [Clostridiales bacterium]|nr:hypothetical protein [Clostridiales bacterium]
MAMTYGTKNRPPRREQNRRHSNAGWGALARLLTAAGLFLLCFVGKTQFPQQTAVYQQYLTEALTGSTDFQAAFSTLGENLAQGGDPLEAVGDWCVAVFAPAETAVDETLPAAANVLLSEEVRFFLTWDGDAAALCAHLLPVEG